MLIANCKLSTNLINQVYLIIGDMGAFNSKWKNETEHMRDTLKFEVIEIINKVENQIFKDIICKK